MGEGKGGRRSRKPQLVRHNIFTVPNNAKQPTIWQQHNPDQAKHLFTDPKDKISRQMTNPLLQLVLTFSTVNDKVSNNWE